jgi:RecG-like helicase
MDKDEKEIWENVQYRMDAEGFHYCFKYYSSFEEIKDENFHKLIKEYLEISDKMEEYVNQKLNEEVDYDLN